MENSDIQDAKELVRSWYKNESGQPFEMTDGQAEIFCTIFSKKHTRNHICTFTRYGKSEVISMAVLTRVSTFPEKWAIVAGNKEKAGIIMADIIKHIFDNDYIKQRFVIGKGESEENIRRYKNKDRINFRLDDGLLGEVFITSAEAAMGLGAPNVVEDEAALVSDNYHSYVMRMLGDMPENFLCKIGNPFDSGHFRASDEDPKYNKIIIDWQQGIREGRLTQDFIDEMRKQPNFGVLYDCKFPPRDQMDDQGWVPLLIKDDIDRAMVDEETVKGFGINRLGVDVAGGGRNFSVMVNRWTNVAKTTYKTHEPDTMTLAERVLSNKELNHLDPNDIYTDKVGIGRGMYDMLHRLIPGVQGINAGESPINDQDKEVYSNLRAQMYWKCREWILAGGKLERSDDWYQFTKVYYRTVIEGSRRGKIQMMPKEEMLRRGIESPDVADALAMTFINPDVIRVKKEDDAFFRAKMTLKKQASSKGYNLKMTNY